MLVNNNQMVVIANARQPSDQMHTNKQTINDVPSVTSNAPKFLMIPVMQLMPRNTVVIIANVSIVAPP